MARPLCDVRIRRNKRCCKPGRYVLDLDMVLCPVHEANEWKLRAAGYDSRQDDRLRPHEGMRAARPAPTPLLGGEVASWGREKHLMGTWRTL